MNKHKNNDRPFRSNFTDTELVGHLDMVGNLMMMMTAGQSIPLEVQLSALTVLRFVRDDLAARADLPTRSLFRDPSYLADCAMRELTNAGAFDRDLPFDQNHPDWDREQDYINDEDRFNGA